MVELLLLEEVVELVVVDVALVQPAFCVVKLPCRPMATSRMGALPVLLTWTVTVVLFPLDKSPISLAETWPFAPCRSDVSCFVSWCLEPMTLSWSVT